MSPLPPRHLMIRDISQYLGDTYGMTPEEVYAFNNLEIAYWLRGFLPTGGEQLAFIARIPLDAWRMLGARVMQAFALGADGLFHHTHASKLRDEEQSKALKRTAKARRAAMFRWHRNELETEGRNLSEVVDAQASSEHETNVTTSLEGSPSRALPLLKPLVKSTNSRAREDGLKPGPIPELPFGPSGWRYAIDGQHRSVIKAKPVKSPRRASRDAVEDAEPLQSRASVMAALRFRRKVASKGRSDPQKPAGGEDTRFEPFKREIFAMWRGMNPRGPRCTWRDEKEGAALMSALREHPDLSLEQFKSCIAHILASIREGELSPTAAPTSWLVRVVEYLQCPLDRFGKPIRKPVQRDRAAPRQL